MYVICIIIRFTRYFSNRRQYAVYSEHLGIVKDILKNCASMYRRKAKTNRVFQSVEQLQLDNKWPYNGLLGLQEELARSMFRLTRFTREEYYWFMGFITVHLYICTPQGRVGGIMTCSREGAISLLATGNACSV